MDLLVAGAGTAGAALAGSAAARGLTVLCVDRGPLDAAGASWVNGITREAFQEAGVPAPEGAELRGAGGDFHMLAGWGPERIVVGDSGLLEVDMRRLVARLQDRAREAGATLSGGVTVEGLDGGAVHTSAGVVRADVIADASGVAGLNLLGAPPIPRRDLCAAAQAVHAVADPSGARAFLSEHGAREGDTLCFAGLAGGYSILNVSVHGDEVSLLTGTIPADGHQSGRALLEGFAAERGWIGARIFGGHRAIPLGRPRDTLARGRVVALGDAARQVFSAHGSGIGPGMVAARTLADALADGGRVEDYAVGWMRRHGGLFAAYDVFRRFSQSLSPMRLTRLMRSGLMDAEATAAGMRQRLPTASVGRLVGMPAALRRAGGVSGPLAAAGARMAGLLALYARYPRAASSRARWSAAVTALHGGAG